MDDELKVCPFCGSTRVDYSEKSVARDYGTQKVYHVAVYCKNCHAYGPRVLTEKVKSNVYPSPFVDLAKAKREAAEKWNRRAGDEKK